jgi:hypothetical protein
VDEIWILETMLHGRDSYLRFERCENDTLVGRLDLQGAELLDKFENGVLVLGSTVTSTKGQPLGWPTSMIDPSIAENSSG